MINHPNRVTAPMIGRTYWCIEHDIIGSRNLGKMTLLFESDQYAILRSIEDGGEVAVLRGKMTYREADHLKDAAIDAVYDALGLYMSEDEDRDLIGQFYDMARAGKIPGLVSTAIAFEPDPSF